MCIWWEEPVGTLEQHLAEKGPASALKPRQCRCICVHPERDNTVLALIKSLPRRHLACYTFISETPPGNIKYFWWSLTHTCTNVAGDADYIFLNGTQRRRTVHRCVLRDGRCATVSNAALFACQSRKLHLRIPPFYYCIEPHDKRSGDNSSGVRFMCSHGRPDGTTRTSLVL